MEYAAIKLFPMTQHRADGFLAVLPYFYKELRYGRQNTNICGYKVQNATASA